MATSAPVTDGDGYSHATGEGVNVALIDVYSSGLNATSGAPQEAGW